MLLSVLAWVVALAPACALLYFALEVVAGLAPLPAVPPPVRLPQAAILVPAHNEALSISDTVRALREVAPAGTRLLVIADNCSDATAALARDAGAEVAERNDPGHRGKGYALAFGRDLLAQDPPEAVIIVDADCRLDPGSIEHLAALAASAGAPVQGLNLLTPSLSAAPLVQISNFAMLVKNKVRARGLARLGGGVLLFGTGMAFPWPLFAKAPLATSDMVEDLRLGLDFARSGVPVLLEERARVTSEPAALADSAGQRRRWEHGFLQTASRNAVPLLAEAVRRRSRHLLALGLHLLVPPVAMLYLIAMASFVLTALYGWLANDWRPAIVLAASLALASVATLAAWAAEGRESLSLAALLQAPLYVLWKLPIYVGFFIARQSGWNRTRRDGEHG